MLVIFCEECGGKNIIAQDTLESIGDQTINCQVCDNQISRETIISYSKSSTGTDTKNLRLLFVDDDPVFLDIMGAAITDEYMVSVAQTGEEGLRLAKELMPSIVFLDVNMPEMDGYEVCKRLKKDVQLRHIPVIFISANRTSNDEWKGLSLGAIDYMNKPIEPQIFHARVGNHIRTQKLLDEQRKEAQNFLEISKKLHRNTILLEEEQYTHRFSLLALKKGLDEADQLVTLLDAQGKITWANKQFLNAFPRPAEKIIGQSCSQFFSTPDTECTTCFKPSVKQNDQYQEVEHFSSTLQALVSHKHIPLFNDDGELLSQIHVASIQDSSQENKKEDRPLEQSTLEHLAEMENIVATLTAVSHSITNSVAEDEQFTQYCNFVTNSLKKLTELFGEIAACTK